MEWFRFYTGTTTDSKIRKITKMTGMNIAEVVGLWAIILCYANDSPIRGTLLIAEDVPVTNEDIADASGCENVTETLRGLQQLDMLSYSDGVYSITNWNKRQFISDDSANRVRKHRDKTRCNDGVTLPEQPSNAPDTEADTEADTELNTGEKAPPEDNKPESRKKWDSLVKVCHIKTITKPTRGRLNKVISGLDFVTAEEILAFGVWYESEEWHSKKYPLDLDRLQKGIGGWVDLGKPSNRTSPNGNQNVTNDTLQRLQEKRNGDT